MGRRAEVWKAARWRCHDGCVVCFGLKAGMAEEKARLEGAANAWRNRVGRRAEAMVVEVKRRDGFDVAGEGEDVVNAGKRDLTLFPTSLGQIRDP